MTLLVKGVRIAGREEDSPLLDVFISGDKISAIGEFPTKKADEVVEGEGAWLIPGFIDASTHADHSLDLWRHPAQEDFAAQGVTTLVGGQGGFSLAPLPHGELELFEEWVGEKHINVNWHGFGEFIAHLKRRPLGVNVASFAGYATVRHAIRGERRRALTKNELRVIEHLLERSLREGALGVSLDLDARHTEDVAAQELKSIVRIVSRHGAIMSIRLARGKRAQSLREALTLAEESGVKLLIDDLAPDDGSDDYEELLGMLDAVPRDREVCFALSPLGERVFPLSHFLPVWAREWETATALKNIRDEWFATRLLKDFPPLRPEAFLILRAPAVRSIENATLKDFMDMHGIRDKSKALLKLLRATDLRGIVRLVSDRRDLVERALAHPRALVASYRTSPWHRHGALFASILPAGNGAGKTMHEAVRMMTHRPARFFGLARRGEVREGDFADLAGWKNGDVRFTIVNGKRATEDGGVRHAGAGRALLRRP